MCTCVGRVCTCFRLCQLGVCLSCFVQWLRRTHIPVQKFKNLFCTMPHCMWSNTALCSKPSPNKGTYRILLQPVRSNT